MPPLPVAQVTLPPAPGVVPLALASTMPAIVALPKTAMTTGLLPTSLMVEPAASDRPRSGRTTMLGPPVWVWTTGVGRSWPHQLVNVLVDESNCDTPQSSVVVGSVPAGFTPGPIGLKLLGV